MKDIELYKKWCRGKVAYLVKIGAIKKPDRCQRCNTPGPVEDHHPNYGKPLDICWWCTKCHRGHHNRNRRRK